MFFEEIPEPKPTEPKPAPTEPKKGAESRFHARVSRFEAARQPWPKLRHHAFWMLHNCISHPFLAVSPGPTAVEFHELTSQWLNHVEPKGLRPEQQEVAKRVGLDTLRSRTLVTRIPTIKKRAAWFVHNAIAHPLIGVLPTKWAFKIHDKTAEAMEVPYWV